LFLLTDSVYADWLFIFVRLLFIQQPGNTHGIYRNVQITPTDLLTLSPRLLKLTRMDSRRTATEEPDNTRTADSSDRSGCTKTSGGVPGLVLWC
jgi:hypothetical protein